MRTLFLFIFILVIFSINKGYSQSISGNTKFSLDGVIIGRDTGSVILWHFDNNNKQLADTAPQASEPELKTFLDSLLNRNISKTTNSPIQP